MRRSALPLLAGLLLTAGCQKTEPTRGEAPPGHRDAHQAHELDGPLAGRAAVERQMRPDRLADLGADAHGRVE